MCIEQQQRYVLGRSTIIVVHRIQRDRSMKKKGDEDICVIDDNYDESPAMHF